MNITKRQHHQLHQRHVKVTVLGSVVIIEPKSVEAADWLDSNVANPNNPSEPVNGEVYCEPRYAVDILEGMAMEICR